VTMGDGAEQVYNRILAAAIDYQNRRLLPEAVALYRFLVAEAPPIPHVYARLAMACRDRGERGEAIDVLHRLIAIAPQNAEAFDWLGQALEDAGREEEAIAAYGRAVDLQPNFTPAFSHLAQLAAAREFEPLAETQERLLRPPNSLSQVYMEVSTTCNLKCQNCARTVYLENGQWVSRHMDLAVYKAVLANLPPAHRLFLYGLGEPSLHPELPEMVRLARASGKFKVVGTTTNALVQGADYYRNLQALGLNQLYVSVDSLTDGVVEACRAQTDPTLLRRRLADLLEVFPELVASTVVSALNLADLPDTIATLAVMGIRSFDPCPIISFPGCPTPPLTAEETATALSHLENARARWPDRWIGTAKFLARTRPAGRCIVPFIATYVSVDGYRCPCSCIPGPPEMMGRTSLAEQTYAETMRSPGLRAWYDAYFARPLTICLDCPMHTGKRGGSGPT